MNQNVLTLTIITPAYNMKELLKEKQCGANNRKAVIPFCRENVKGEVMDLFKEF